MISDLIDHYTLEAHAVQHNRPWTAVEHSYLEQNLRFQTCAQIAEHLGRSQNALKIRGVRQQIPAPSKHPGYYTGNQVACILRVDIHSIMRLHELGLLKMHVLPGERHIMQISRIGLWVWAINPEHWIYFKPGRVRDVRLRRLIELRRQRWGDEWWTTGQIARYYGLACSNSVEAAIKRIHLPAVKWGNWYVKKSNALAHPFFARKGRPGTPRGNWTARGDAFLLKARDEWRLQWVVIGRLMKWPEKTAMYRYKTLTNPQHPRV
jgi:hypothetical protein